MKYSKAEKAKWINATEEGMNKVYEQFSRDYEQKKKFNTIDDFVFVPERTLGGNEELRKADIDALNSIGKEFIEYMRFGGEEKFPIVAYYDSAEDRGAKIVNVEPFSDWFEIDGFSIPTEKQGKEIRLMEATPHGVIVFNGDYMTFVNYKADANNNFGKIIKGCLPDMIQNGPWK